MILYKAGPGIQCVSAVSVLVSVCVHELDQMASCFGDGALAGLTRDVRFVRTPSLLGQAVLRTDTVLIWYASSARLSLEGVGHVRSLVFFSPRFGRD